MGKGVQGLVYKHLCLNLLYEDFNYWKSKSKRNWFGIRKFWKTLYNSMSVPGITESYTLKKPVTILLCAFYLNFKNTDIEQDPNFEGKE